ncbi:hypothetical protein BDP81DRAFT_59993 [Colletotrichum phormii]|uniref:Uncharacterized protein n=1 Tax=Colletotrichum phormii TaxID=359342 RepID=A0AAJ0EEW5_9PEZI|nr:uncharacterized protein BDP81DRAFT_59993 [Colletotrichum phormii]KAK1634496.1 hypothetical protein BDP81DRAFT_59993 [Colletotrichum phormii]
MEVMEGWWTTWSGCWRLVMTDGILGRCISHISVVRTIVPSAGTRLTVLLTDSNEPEDTILIETLSADSGYPRAWLKSYDIQTHCCRMKTNPARLVRDRHIGGGRELCRNGKMEPPLTCLSWMMLQSQLLDRLHCAPEHSSWHPVSCKLQHRVGGKLRRTPGGAPTHRWGYLICGGGAP